MERMLEKLAQQLNSLDEASLITLWGRYAARVENFEPTKRWEEAALCLCLCQAMRWKNQLFNHHFASSVQPKGPQSPRPENSSANPHTLEPHTGRVPAGNDGAQGAGRRSQAAPGKVLTFSAPLKQTKAEQPEEE